MTIFKPCAYLALFMLFVLPINRKIMAQTLPSLNDARSNSADEGRANPPDQFLRPINPLDHREAGDLWAMPMPDGCLRISPLRQWSQTGLELRESQRLEIQAEGYVQGCQRPVGDWAYGPWGPAGGPATEDHPGSRVCALIGRVVGEEETREFIVGESFQCEVSAGGKLELGVSDIWHFDNSGEFAAAIQVDGKPVDFVRHQVVELTVATENLAPAMQPMNEAEIHELDGARRLGSRHKADRPMLATEQRFRPPLEIRARARTDSVNIRLYYGYFGIGELIFNWEVRPDELRLHDPATGAVSGIRDSGGIEKNVFHDIVWRIGLRRMQVLVDGEERYRGEGDYRTVVSPVGIGPAWGSRVDVESLVIAPLDPAVMNTPSDSTTELGSQELHPIPPVEDLPGRLVFQGKYLHRSRGREYGESAGLWVKQKEDGSIVALSEFANQATLAVGDADHRPIRYSTARGPSLADKNHLKFEENKVSQLKNWNDDQAIKEYATEEGAIFDPNTRPDPYVMANILVRQFNLQPGDSEEFLMFDWSAAGDKQDSFPSYRVRVEHKGKENVTVPAGTFEANHLVQTQLTRADTWFKKRAGHVTEFWFLDDYTIVRILRHREPYEVSLKECNFSAQQPGMISGPREQTTSTTSTADSARFNELLAVIKTPIEAQDQEPQLFPIGNDASQRSYKLSGKVLDATPDISDKTLAKLASVDGEEWDEEFAKIFKVPPASNAVVVLKAGAISLQARTDSEGNFEFPRLQSGSYEISCEYPMDLFGEKRVATGKTRIDLGFAPYRNVSDRTITLEIRADRVTIEGRITDINGRPVAGAKVIGKRVKYRNPFIEMAGDGEAVPEPEEFTAVSAADGSYVLQGFEPTKIGVIAKYLVHVRGETDDDILDYAEVHVEYPPLMLDKAQVERVPLVTEESLTRARRLLPILFQMAKRAGDPSEVKIKEDIPLPSSHGNTITGIDIVLDQAGMDVR